jgi:hypothetical protein
LQLNENGLHRLQLNHNSLEPDSLCVILEALKKQIYFKSLVVHENEVTPAVVHHISNLVSKKLPENLEMLRLSHCKMNWKTTQMLL